MGVFEDKRYEALDWVSQAVEPIESPLTAILGNLPESLDIDYNLFSTIRNSSYGHSISVESAISHLLKQEGSKVSWDDSKLLSSCFKFEVEAGTTVDTENGTIVGNIKLVKVKSTLEEDELKSLLGKEGINTLRSIRHYELNVSRANELLEMIGKCEEALRSRSAKTKIRGLILRLDVVMKTNEWNIKDTELANKVGVWLAEYLEHGNLAALGNFAKLKVMTHKGLPIYSMEEIK